ncbi:lipid IV(A) 3-deoxy-D-manno-octulosonic acid transferase [Legionella sp. CNM-4043-24]|uniref:lipid IV(A) 3-deoxy-D-manno-octulosonic acid transferase n=1 Tax=Legionella sp. CNM-4043-24 TaxID=3421646 RepID=UPI00403ACF71
MRQIYSFLLYILSPLILLRLWWKGLASPAYRERIAERFCLDGADAKDYDVWVHAVSLGEVIAATPLIEALLAKQYRLLVTTTTATGAGRVQVQFSSRVMHRHLPYDLPDVVRRFFKMNQMRVAVIMETELWPNLIRESKQNNVPMLLVNARLSERSCRGYRRLSWLIKPVLNDFHAILTQSTVDAERFISIGARSEIVQVAGNVKFDLNTHDIDREKYSLIKATWGAERPVVILASTHEDEEAQVLMQAKELQRRMPGVLILIAPRHPERFQTVFNLAQALGFSTGKRSEADSMTKDCDVIILDCMGELLGFYSLSDYAFLGGSFVPVGGHNMLEAIAMRVPVLTGPKVHNFKAIVRDLIAADAIVMVDDASDLVNQIDALHRDEARRTRLIEQAMSVLESNKGALLRYVDRIESLIRSTHGGH